AQILVHGSFYVLETVHGSHGENSKRGVNVVAPTALDIDLNLCRIQTVE
ncbi:hypothetical protein A2U01_0092218, partial [Trifolium medium]|nr:hypothetical protein [Trifolium medium]